MINLKKKIKEAEKTKGQTVSGGQNPKPQSDGIREEAEKHPSCQEWRTSKQIEQGEPKVYIRLVSFGDSSVNLRANVWAAGPIEAFEMECDLNKSVKKRFDAEGIEIPFPHRTLVYKNKPAS